MTQIPQHLSERAQWHLCLSRAFLTSDHPGVLDALRTDLIADLDELNTTLGLFEPTALTRLQQALNAIPDQQSLLLTYSRLFLAPPAPALLNLGFYLDGALMGSVCQQIEDLYDAYGLGRDANFHDTPDHLALYLQFIAWVYVRILEAVEENALGQAQQHLQDAFATLRRHALPAMERLIEQIDKAQAELALPTVYGQLARLSHEALLQDAAAIHRILPDEAITQPDIDAIASTPPEQTRIQDSHCTQCGEAFVADTGLQHMVDALAAQGLSTDHLFLCADCRTNAMGMQPMTPPGLKKATRTG